MKTIFFQTIQTAVRQKYLLVLTVVLLALFAIVAFNSVIAYKAKQQSFEKARQSVRSAWLNQGPQNPHNSAHYGHYIFQPVSAMQFLVNGIRSFAGSILRLEAHAQNEAAFSPAQDKTELSRFGDMSFAWMLQVLMPLFIILLCFNAVNVDRENENLKLLVAQGISKSKYLWGKIIALYSIVLTLSFIGLTIQLLSYSFLANGITKLSFADISLWLLLYAVYLFIITNASVLASAWIHQSKSSLLVQIATWVILVLVMPKITANAGATIFPLEHKAVFSKTLKEDREKGIDGHNPADKRSKLFEDSLLKKYGVDSMNKLPVNADGLLMQADEEYANIVYDKHFNRIRQTISNQNSISKYTSFINPYFAIRNSSMNISKSSFNNHLNLLSDAEQYRRYLIKTLNDKMAYGGSKTGDWDWKVDAKYWETVKDFTYPETTITQSVKNSKTELAALSVWFLLAIIGVAFTSKKLNVL